MTYLPGLDLVRFVAALLVMVFHLSWRNPSAPFQFASGWVGVEIFFLISGFVISASAQNVSARSFVQRRVARLYPAAFCCLIPCAALMLLAGTQDAEALGIGLVSSPGAIASSLTLMTQTPMVTALWTLPIEIFFYALMLVLILLGRVHRVRAIAFALILWSAPYIAMAWLGDFGITHRLVPDLGYGFLNLTLWRHGCFFGLGMLLWHLQSSGRDPAAIAMALLALLLGCMEVSGRAVTILHLYVSPPPAGALIAAAVGWFLIGAVAIRAFSDPAAALRWPSGLQRGLRALGLMSYPVYLLHEALGGILLASLTRHGVPPLAGLITAMGIVLLAAFIVVRFAEPPVRKALMSLMNRAGQR